MGFFERRQLISAVILIVLVQIGSNQLLDLEEGEVCRRWWGSEWSCKTIGDCPEVGMGIHGGNRPIICSFNGRTPIVCCPPNESSPSPIKSKKAKEYCERIRSTCGGKKKVSGGPKRPFSGFGSGKPWFMGGERFQGGWGGGRMPNSPWNSRRARYSSRWFNGRYKRQIEMDFSEEQRPSIIGGNFVFARTRPYMALIGYGSADDKQWNCGGSLISEKFVLSAAHCAESSTQGPAKWVLLGELDLSTNRDDARPEEVPIIRRVVHPEYKEPAIYNDLAIFEMERAITFSQWVRPVCLQTELTVKATKATATGWGRTDFVGETSPRLMEVDLTLVDGEECKSLFVDATSNRLPEGIDTKKMICAGEKEGGKDTCSGDSGGPLVIRSPGTCLYSQIGLTSFGRQCGLPNSPGVYTRISNYVQWIESVVWP